MALGDLVTIINRTPNTLTVTRNGAERDFEPGENPNTPWEWLYYCKNQHPLMGSEDADNPLTGEYLLVRKDSKDNAKRLYPEELQGIERIDREGQLDVEVITGRKRPPSMSPAAPPVMVGTGA